MNKKQLYFLDIYIEEDYGWFASYNCNGLFGINFITGDVKCIGIFPAEKSNTQFMFNNIVCQNDQLFFIPDMFDSIGIYDRKSEKLICKVIPQEITDKKSFCFSTFYNNNLILFPSNASFILRYNIEKQIIEKVEISELKQTGFCFTSRFFAQFDEKIYVPVQGKNEILEVDLATKKYRFHTVGKDGEIFCSMCQQDKNIWLVEAYTGKLVKYDIKSESYQEFAMRPNGYRCIKEHGYIIAYMFYDEEWIYIVPSTANMVLKFNVITESYEIMDTYEKWEQKEFPFYVDSNHGVLASRYVNKKIYSLRAGDLKLLVYDTSNCDSKKEIDLITDEKQYVEKCYLYNPNEIFLREDTDAYGLKDYLLLLHKI